MRRIDYDQAGSMTTRRGALDVRARVATTFRDRLVGLIGQREVEPLSLLVFPKCTSIHMFWMRVPIDVAWLSEPDASGTCRIVREDHALAPGRVSFGPRPAWGCAELRAGSLAELEAVAVTVPALARFARGGGRRATQGGAS